MSREDGLQEAHQDEHADGQGGQGMPDEMVNLIHQKFLDVTFNLTIDLSFSLSRQLSFLTLM